MNHTDKATILEWMGILEQVNDKIEDFFIENKLLNCMDCSKLQTVQGLYVWDTLDAILKQMENKLKEPRKKQKPRQPKDEEEIEERKPFRLDDSDGEPDESGEFKFPSEPTEMGNSLYD